MAFAYTTNTPLYYFGSMPPVIAHTSDGAGPSSHHRARSEPPAGGMNDVEMAPPHSSVKRAQSHWNLSRISTTYHSPTLEEVSESQEASQSQHRSVSPAATEIDDPELEYVEKKLHKLGAKIRDFAYEESLLKRIPELFDQYDAIAEFEYRLSQQPREYPIQGKTLRRLLDIGWIDQREVDERCEEMDFQELAKVDRRPHWPFVLKFQREECLKRPNSEERFLHMQSRKYGHIRMDRFRRTVELDELRKLQYAAEGEQAMESIRNRERRLALVSALKRPLGEGEETLNESEQKRRRYDDLEYGCSQAQMPLKQYPAPLFSYDPEIYPEAAGAIESQSQSQPRPVVVPPPRVDTPPLEEEEDTRPNALKRPVKGLKRTLSRTQTFTQL